MHTNANHLAEIQAILARLSAEKTSVSDLLEKSRDYIRCARLAAISDNVDKAAGGAIATVLDHAEDCLELAHLRHINSPSNAGM